MGWDFIRGFDRKKTISYLTEDRASTDPGSTFTSEKTLAKKVVKGVLYFVREFTYRSDGRIQRILCVALLQADRRDNSYGFKLMDEAMGPCVYDCPVEFFDLVPNPGSYATDWRETCRQEAKRKEGK
jgi:hypothetical protein